MDGKCVCLVCLDWGRRGTPRDLTEKHNNIPRDPVGRPAGQTRPGITAGIRGKTTGSRTTPRGVPWYPAAAYRNHFGITWAPAGSHAGSRGRPLGNPWESGRPREFPYDTGKKHSSNVRGGAFLMCQFFLTLLLLSPPIGINPPTRNHPIKQNSKTTLLPGFDRYPPTAGYCPWWNSRRTPTQLSPEVVSSIKYG